MSNGSVSLEIKSSLSYDGDHKNELIFPLLYWNPKTGKNADYRKYIVNQNDPRLNKELLNDCARSVKIFALSLELIAYENDNKGHSSADIIAKSHEEHPIPSFLYIDNSFKTDLPA